MTTAAELVPAGPGPTLVLDRGGSLATSEVIARAKQIREVMESVMKKDVHYGVIPGTQKPTMYQPGADVLAVTFRIAPKIGRLEDLSSDDDVRYRITVQGFHQISGEMLAEGVGECSSNEEKYRWRKPVCDEEWKETAEDRRREKWARGQGGKTYKQKQIRTSPADVANTVLKMAVKRGKIAMILNATAASDVFAQDLEDLSEELRESLADEHRDAPAPIQQPQRREEPAEPPVNGTAAATTTKPAGVLIAKVDRKEHTKKPGYFYTIVHTEDGKPYFTDNDVVSVACEGHKEAKRRVEISAETKDGYPCPVILEVTVVEGQAS
jgi:hypothetical protein